MKQKATVGIGLQAAGLAAAILILISSCSVFSQKKETPSTPAPEKGTKAEAPLYYDFGDVPVPQELKLQRDSSFIYNSGGFAAGVMVLKGRVEIRSVIDFFENNMARDNWRSVSSFKSARTLLLFQKQNRWCVININGQDYYTHVEIWVAPTNLTGSGLLK